MNREIRLTIRFNTEEYRRVSAHAMQCGTPVSTFARYAILKETLLNKEGTACTSN